jgi:hypothetical protein
VSPLIKLGFDPRLILARGLLSTRNGVKGHDLPSFGEALVLQSLPSIAPAPHFYS